jgi:hypothetical protein
LTGMLYVCNRPGQGVARIRLDRVRGAVGLTLTRGRRVEHYNIKTLQASVNPSAPNGEPIITLRIAGRDDYALSEWPGAVAVSVTHLFFWWEDGHWRLDRAVSAAAAQSTVERRFSASYDLPE